MTESDISAIEDALVVKLPADYARFLKKPLESIDETTVLRDADLIIGATRDYRQGFEGLKPWPQGVRGSPEERPHPVSSGGETK